MNSVSNSEPRPVPLYPPLGTPETLKNFAKSGRALSLALSPRSNGIAVFETPANPLQKDIKRPNTVLYFAQWDRVRTEDVELYTESYVTFESLQRVSFLQQQEEGISITSSQNVINCWRAVGVYVDNVHAHLDRLGMLTPFDESRYLHYMSVASTFHLFQTVYTSDSGNITSALIGEELLLWLNMHYIAPTSDEGPDLDAHEKPWLEDTFWTFLIRCIMRGIPKSAVYFLTKVSKSHPSRVLRRLMTELIPVLNKHPRSKDYSTEHEFLAAYRRWKEQMLRNFRRHVDELDENDGLGREDDEGEWRNGVEIICSIMEGNKDVVFSLCKDQEWGWREALGIWGVWVDTRFNRDSLPTTLPIILENLPVNPNHPDELVQTSLLSYDPLTSIEAARKWDLWLAVHMTDMFDKLGELEPPSQSNKENDDPSLRTSLLIEYSEHLHSDATLWQITLEYLAACGAEGRSLLAEVLKHVSVDINLPTTKGKEKEKVPRTPVKQSGLVNGSDDMMTTDDLEGDNGEAKAWTDWEAKILKIITVCKDYGLDEVMLSVCKSISQALMRRGLYGRAVQYSVLAKDGRGVGRIADLLLQEYISKGADEFLAQVATIPAEFLPSPTANVSPIDYRGDVFSSRLQFISRYAEFHNMYARGERREAARYLVVMLSARIVPKWWWGVVLLDAGGMLDDDEMLISMDEAYELLRHLEEIYIRAEQGSGSDYLGALERIMRGGADDGGEASTTEDALRQLQVVRLALARYLARCSVAGF